MDGVTHFLFAPKGTRSLDDPVDFEMMEELSYHDSLKGDSICFSPSVLRNILTNNQEHWLQYYTPRLSAFLNKFNIRCARPSPLSNDYVLNSAAQPHPSDFSVISKLQSKASELEEFTAPAECMDHLAAGIDTTGDGICFLMYQLSLPESRSIQQRLHEELLSNQSTPFDQLPYLDAVIKEGLRLFPPIPMSFPRYVPQGGKILEKHFIPSHTIVSCQPWTLHKNAVAFPSPETFRPERWLEEKGKSERERMFFAFSQGSRGCIGKNLAMAEMKILLREVYSKCRTCVSGDMKGDMTLSDQIISSRPAGQTCLLAFERI